MLPRDGITDTDTDPSERSALASHLDYGHMNLESPARPVLDVTQDGTTDTDSGPSERSALASHLDYVFLYLDLSARSVVNVALDGRPMEGITDPLPFVDSGLVLALGSGFTEDKSRLKLLEHSVSDMDVDINIVEMHDEPMLGLDRRCSFLKFTDAMRQEALRTRPVVWTSSVDHVAVLPAVAVLPVEYYLSDREMCHNDVNSEGFRYCNTDMDVMNQYETFNGLLVYYGGDMDDCENRMDDTVDMVPMCQTVSCVTQIGQDEFSDTSGTVTAVVNGPDMDDLSQGPESSDEEDCFVSDVGSSICRNRRTRYIRMLSLSLTLIVIIR